MANVQLISEKLAKFIRRHRAKFDQIPHRQSALLELGAITLASEHYRLNGYKVRARNLTKNVFRVKVTSRGHPKRFSWFEAERDGRAYEIHCNLPVQGAYLDGGIYVLDTAVVKAGSVPEILKKNKDDKTAVENRALRTFVEVKGLVVFPMLLAQFVGIVHEILPRFIDPTRRNKNISANHFFPSLLTTGYLSHTSTNIVQGFRTRGYRITVVTNFDGILGQLRAGKAVRSPFDPTFLPNDV